MNNDGTATSVRSGVTNSVVDASPVYYAGGPLTLSDSRTMSSPNRLARRRHATIVPRLPHRSSEVDSSTEGVYRHRHRHCGRPVWYAMDADRQLVGLAIVPEGVEEFEVAASLARALRGDIVDDPYIRIVPRSASAPRLSSPFFSALISRRRV